MKNKLNNETKQTILHLADNSDGISAVYLLISRLITNMEREVLNVDLSKYTFANLAIMKAKLDGARLLESRFRNEILTIKGEVKNGRQQ